MRRLPRILRTTATLVSLVFCVTTLALWLRSYTRRDEFSFVTQRTTPSGAWGWRQWEFRSGAGRLVIYTGHRYYRSPDNIRYVQADLAQGSSKWTHDRRTGRPYMIYDRDWNHLGFYPFHRWGWGWAHPAPTECSPSPTPPPWPSSP